MKLGTTQKYVLLVLSHGSRTVDQIGYPMYSDASVASALRRLYDRGLVEPVRWAGQRREWEITDRGLAVVDV